MHLLEFLRKEEGDAPEKRGYFRLFLGKGMQYSLLCTACKAEVNEVDLNGFSETKKISEKEFADIEKKCNLLGVTGKPEVLIAKEQLKLEFSYQYFSGLHDQIILDIQPFYHAGHTRWMAVTAAGCLIRINEGSNFVEPSSPIGGPVDFSRPIVTSLSPNQRFLVIANTYGMYGCVVDLTTEKICFKLKRDDYHTENCIYPIVFFEMDGKTFLVHATQWNRLDVTDVETGKCVTDREWPEFKEEEKKQHVLDYFYGSLLISPEGRWIYTSGWVWHPVGKPEVFSLEDWLRKNIWESEDGPSRKGLAQLDYWPTSAAWINENLLLVDALEGDFFTSTGVRIVDVKSGHTTKSFAGPSGDFFFDHFLFSCGMNGFSAWDIATGERVLQELSFRPRWYHRVTKQFLSLGPKNILQLGMIR